MMFTRRACIQLGTVTFLLLVATINMYSYFGGDQRDQEVEIQFRKPNHSDLYFLSNDPSKINKTTTNTTKSVSHSLTNAKGLMEIIADLVQNVKNNMTTIKYSNKTLNFPQNPSEKPVKSPKTVSNITPIKYKSSEQRKILIYSRGRSGSSFVAEIFARHPESYYLFEPFKAYPINMVKLVTPDFMPEEICKGNCRVEEQGEKVLNGAFNCDFKSITFDGTEQNFMRTGNLMDLKHIWSFIHCRRKNQCGPQIGIYKTLSGEICQLHKSIIIKTIRLQNITAIRNLMERGIKVVHLVRDPRGKIKSEIQYLTGSPGMAHRKRWTDTSVRQYVEISSKNLCKDMEISLELAKSGNRTDNYLLLRYEDIALDALNKTQDLYKFAGVRYHQSIDKWLRNATQFRRPGLWATSRVSSDTALDWKTKLKKEYREIVEKNCYGVIKTLGYSLL